MKIDHYGLTEKGGRPVNEDCIGYARRGDAYCFIVCDGLGGHGMGDKASQLVTRYIEEKFAKCGDIEQFADEVLIKAQRKLLKLQMAEDHRMLTTVTVLIIEGDKGITLHIGDSRIYRFRDGVAVWRTRDHSVPQVLAITGDIRDEDIRSHPDRNRLLRALGDECEIPRYEKQCFDIAEGDAFLLCSDGFWEPVTEEQMCGALSGCSRPKRWLNNMKRIIRSTETADSDNYSAVGVMIKG